MAIDRNLRDLRAALNLTQQNIADVLNLSPQAISKWERGLGTPSVEQVEQLAAHYRFPPEILVQKDGVRRHVDERTGKLKVSSRVPADAYTSTTTAPLVGSISAGAPIEAIPRAAERIFASPVVLEAHPDGFFLVVSGDSMNRVLHEGCYVFVDPKAEVKTGDVAAVNVNGEDVTIKRIHFAGDTVVLHPESTNPDHHDVSIDSRAADADRVRIIGKVVWATYPESFKF